MCFCVHWSTACPFFFCFARGRTLVLPSEERWQSQHRRRGTEQFWAEWQPFSASSSPDSWGALIRACGWNCTGMHAADGPAEETGITVCDADTLFALPLSSAADSICLSLESQKSKRSHKEQLRSCRSVKLRSAIDSVLSPSWEWKIQAMKNLKKLKGNAQHSQSA